MKIRGLLGALPAPCSILRAASFLVPKEGRAEWLAEWKAELWQVCHSRSGRTAGGEPGSDERECAVQEATAFCLGAFPDALWLRRNRPRAVPRLTFHAGSAPRCGLGLTILATTGALACFCLPGARRALLPLPYRDAANLAIVSGGNYSAIRSPGVRLADYRSWRTDAGNVFQGIAFYQPATEVVRIGRHRPAALTIARASENLFALLNLPLTGGTSSGPHAAQLILTYPAWQRLFHGDPDVAGRVVQIAGKPVMIAGILPKDFWRLPGRMDGWMLEDERGLDALPPESKGFVLAHLRASAFAGGDGWQSLYVTRSGGEVDHFTCISLARQSRQPFTIFLFALSVACLALPATMHLPLGDYPERGGRLPRSIRARRWIFLAAKFALVVPAVFFCACSVAYGAFAPSSSAAVYLQLGCSFFGLLFAFRWTLRDQRKRCPVCLRLLTNPARVGEASRNFLAWNGTELICAKGHGLLHIPELPTSWFGAQRWLYLDSSWHSLFTDPYVTAKGAM